jgi:hypothetical protein
MATARAAVIVAERPRRVCSVAHRAAQPYLDVISDVSSNSWWTCNSCSEAAANIVCHSLLAPGCT